MGGFLGVCPLLWGKGCPQCFFLYLARRMTNDLAMENVENKGVTLGVQRFVVNDFGECTYLLYGEGGEGILIDSGFLYDEEWEQFIDFVEKRKVTISLLLNTHGHIDHVCGVGRVLERWKVPFAMHSADVPLLLQGPQFGGAYARAVKGDLRPSILLESDPKFTFAGHPMEIIRTPGHTQGGCCFYLPEENALFSGDTLFEGSIGRTDLPGGDFSQLIASIRDKLFALPGDCLVLPGHGEQTTIAKEQRENPFFS